MCARAYVCGPLLLIHVWCAEAMQMGKLEFFSHDTLAVMLKKPR